LRAAPRSTLFPYTTLFRSRRKTRGAKAAIKTLLPALREQRGTWFRVAEFAAKSSASVYASQLRKEHQGYEWRSAGSESGSVLWADRKSTRLNSSHVKISYA